METLIRNITLVLVESIVIKRIVKLLTAEPDILTVDPVFDRE